MLQRNISSQYYYRLLQSQHKDLVEREMLDKTKEMQDTKLEFIKNPVMAEFLGLASNTDLSETELESSIISNSPLWDYSVTISLIMSLTECMNFLTASSIFFSSNVTFSFSAKLRNSARERLTTF